MLTILALLACRPDPAPPDDGCTPTDPAWPSPVTTLTASVIPDDPLASPTEVDPAFPDGLAAARDQGLGGWQIGAGEPRIVRDDLAPGHGAGTGDRRSLWMVFHQSDAQLADTESPTRMMSTDQPAATQSAARPQELYAIHALDALLRTADAIAETVPVDFGLATGDDADSTQSNELDWFADVWDGVAVKPDSGDPDTQVDDDCNDPLAEFTPAGVSFPWYSVAGNHDVLVQGNFDPAIWADDVLGADAPLGTRDLSEPGGPVTNTAVPDASRKLLERSDIAARFLDSPATPGPVGHGFTQQNVADDSVHWVAKPVDGVPIELVALDMNPMGSDDGALSIEERDEFLIPTLDAAQAAGDLVVMTSHYTMGERAVEGGGTVGDILLRYPNVVLVLAGHSHVNRIQAFGDPGEANGFWQIETASSVDWPGEGRFVELVDNGDGTLSIFTTVLDYAAPEGSLAAEARTRTAIDWQSGWRLFDGTGDTTDRNTELVEVLPDGWSTSAGRSGVRSDLLP